MGKSSEEMVCQGIKQSIFQGLVLAGAPLREQELAAYFGVSRTPVRNALRRLQHEGIIEIRPNRGAFVVRPDPKQVLDAFSLRSHLEAFSARCAAQHITDRELNDLDQVLKVEDDAYRRGDALTVLSAGSDFHRLIAEASRHRLLQRYVNEIIDQTYVFFVFFDVVDPTTPRSPAEHRQILNALTQHDPDLSERLMGEHLQRQVADLDLSRGLPGLAPWSGKSATPLQVGDR